MTAIILFILFYLACGRGTPRPYLGGGMITFYKRDNGTQIMG